eukprot:m.307596 g.307596  ORF g.307596 m.307596 type:complete len:274 (+) comp42503_c0_seq1:53-874(+)
MKRSAVFVVVFFAGLGLAEADNPPQCFQDLPPRNMFLYQCFQTRYVKKEVPVFPEPVKSCSSRFCTSIFDQIRGKKCCRMFEGKPKVTLVWSREWNETECFIGTIENVNQIQSPGFPENYPPNLQCCWHFHLAPGQRVKFRFSEFELEKRNRGECMSDYVEVSTIPRRKKWSDRERHCGTEMPRLKTVHAKEVRVKFVSDIDKTFKGFALNISVMRPSGTTSPPSHTPTTTVLPSIATTSVSPSTTVQSTVTATATSCPSTPTVTNPTVTNPT